jgi:hypothetical protein
MTGQLVVDITAGNANTIGLNVLNSVSGAIIHGEKFLTSSGTIVTESGAYIDGNTLVVQANTNFVGIGTASPAAAYQFQNKFRAEVRSKSGIMRGREFIMKDLYSFHTSQEDLDAYYERAIEAYKKIFARCGLGEKTYLTFASGGTFSKYSHEFQFRS